MGLFVPPCGFSYYASNLTGTPSATAPGTLFTFGTINTDGATVGVITTPTERDVHRVVIGFGGAQASADNNHALVDILRDPAGGTSYTNWIDNLIGGFSSSPGSTIPVPHWYDFPLYLKAGSTLAVRARKNGTIASDFGRIIIHLFGEPSRPEQYWCGQGVEALGINESTSKGTGHNAGSTGAWSTFTTIGTTTKRYGNIALAINGSDSAAVGYGYYWQLGIGGQQIPGTPTYYTSHSTSETVARSSFLQSVPCDIPAGTNIQIRGTSSSVGETVDLAVYGIF